MIQRGGDRSCLGSCRSALMTEHLSLHFVIYSLQLCHLEEVRDQDSPVRIEKKSAVSHQLALEPTASWEPLSSQIQSNHHAWI